MPENPWKWGWDAVSAIGQCVGSLLTAIGIYLALRKDKPRIKLLAIKMPAPEPRVGYLEIHAINNGYIPISIIYTCIEDPRNKKQSRTFTKCSYFIEPSKEEIVSEFRLPALESIGFKKFEYVYYFISIYDNYGNRYQLKKGIVARIIRKCIQINGLKENSTKR